MSDTEPPSRAGSRFGPYQLIRLLGRGAMGEVYQAEDTRKRRVVALKLISEQFSANPVFRARMQREADTAGRLTEPHVVPIHDYGVIDGQFYVDMRLIKGTDLRNMLTRFGSLSPARTVAILRQIAEALDAVHATGVMHRDVKPENILITDNDFAYLADFGIARADTDAVLTQAGTTVGTYPYMAPERFTSDDVTYRADIYALACVLYECLTGSCPYRTDSIERLITAHLMQPVPRPSQLRPGKVPVAFDQVIARGMAKNPAERYRSAGDLATAAHNALTAPEQRQAATILQHSEEATVPSSAADIARARARFTPTGADPEAIVPPARPRSADETMLRGVPTGTGAETWKPPGGRPPTPAPPTGTAWTPPRAAGTGSWPSQPGTTSSVSPPSPPTYSHRPQAQPAPERRGKRKLWLLAGAAALAVIVAVGAIGYWRTRPPESPPPPPWNEASGQTVLPFNDLNFPVSPGGVAVDSAGNVYATSQLLHGKVVKLAVGESSAVPQRFTSLYQPHGVAVDTAGTVYVTDFNKGVTKLAAGSNTPTVLAFTDVPVPEGVAVDSAGTVYVADRGNNRVLKLAAGSNTQTELPFTGLNHPVGVAVDTDGAVYITDSDNNRVLKLAAGSSTQTELPFAGLTVPWGVAVDTAGAVYVTDHDANKVVKLATGANTPTELPLTGLNTPLGVAVDTAGNVYVADRGNNRVVRLAS